MKKLFTLLLVIIAVAGFGQGVTKTSVNPDGETGSRSLTGSYVAFDPSVGGSSSFTPGVAQDFVFRAESYSSDWEYVYYIWLQFPSGWVVNNVSVFGTPDCDNGSWGSLNFSVNPLNAVEIYHPRYQSSSGDHCTAYYMVNVIPGATTGAAEVSWYWSGDRYGGAPHNPCSDDGYYPPGWTPCDEMINPPALIPGIGALDCLPNAIFSQPPVNFNNGFFSDESTIWTNQRIFENFSGLATPINGITFWGILYNGGDCYTGGADDFVITFYQDNAGAVGTMVKSFSLTVTPEVTGSSIVGADLLRYDITLPSFVSLSNGWVMLYRENPGNTDCAFAWANTSIGDYFNAWNNYGGSLNYETSANMAFCLTGGSVIPVSNWALFIGIGLILVFAVVRFRKMS
jgi:hypothetical protein